MPPLANANTIYSPPLGASIVDKEGVMNPAWYTYFKQIRNTLINVEVPNPTYIPTVTANLVVSNFVSAVLSNTTTANIGSLAAATANIGGTSFEADGTLVMANTVWSEAPLTTIGVKYPASSPPTVLNWKGIEVPSFKDSTTDLLPFATQMPHSWKEGSNISVHIHTIHTNNSAGNTIWKLSYAVTNIGSVFPDTLSTVTTNVIAPEVANSHGAYTIANIDMTGKILSTMIVGNIQRDGATDSYANDIILLGTDILFEQDTIGSRNQWTK